MNTESRLPADPRFKGATPEKLVLALKKKKRKSTRKSTR